ncbi:MAG: ATP-binding cassette domain-containing protein [Rhodocyclaceae bacterium]|nr:ATP-binding cassette domain-containing protein [Rhodocyclaceae bacterium]
MADEAPPAGALRLESLSVGPLGPIDLRVEPGEIVALSGASGSGKSRLLRAIADLDAHGGVAALGDTAQDALPAHRWRRAVMLLPAESLWWADTVGEHFPDGRVPEPAALGLDAGVAGWEVARLSSGEKQRLALLRVLARRPRCLLLDEPSANLDEAATQRVETLVGDYVRDASVPALWVSHDPAQIARVASRHLRIGGSGLEVAG